MVQFHVLLDPCLVSRGSTYCRDWLIPSTGIRVMWSVSFKHRTGKMLKCDTCAKLNKLRSFTLQEMDVLVPKITIWIAVQECHRPGISTREWPRELPLGCCHLRSSLVHPRYCQRLEPPRVRICAKTCSFGRGNKSLLEEFPVHLQVIWLNSGFKEYPLVI